MYDIIIVGAGPAGLTAALYAGRANKKILVLEAKAYGGQIVSAHEVSNYPGIQSISGIDYATNLYNETGDIYLVADVLGHTSVDTTRKHYADMTDARRRMAAEHVHLPGDPDFRKE